MVNKRFFQKYLTTLIAVFTIFNSISTAHAELIRYDFESTLLYASTGADPDAIGFGYVIIDDELISSPHLGGKTGVVEFDFGVTGGTFGTRLFTVEDLADFYCICGDTPATSDLTFSSSPYLGITANKHTDYLDRMRISDNSTVSQKYKNRITKVSFVNSSGALAQDDPNIDVIYIGDSIEIDVLANDSDSDSSLVPDSVKIVTAPINGTTTINPSTGEITYTHNGSTTTTDSFTYNVENNEGLVSNIATVNLMIRPIGASCNKSVSLDGNDWINITDLPLHTTGFDSFSYSPPSGNFTIEAWVKLAPGIDAFDALLGQEGTGLDINFYQQKMRLFTTDDSGDAITSNSLIQANRWTHVAITRKESALSLYINGKLDATGSWSGPVPVKALGRGHRSLVENFTGEMDEVRIWYIARTPSEIALNYNKTVDTPYANLLQYLTFNGTGQTVTNSTQSTFWAIYGGDGTLGAGTEVANDDPTRQLSTAPLLDNCFPVKQPPVANKDVLGPLDRGHTITIDILANDIDTDGSLNLESVGINTTPTNGTVTVDQITGQISYTHDGSVTTSDTFTYTVEDNEGAISNVATVFIGITPNQAPVAVNDNAGSIESSGTTTINVLTNDSDGDGTLNLGSVMIETTPVNGTASVDPVTGQITYTHDGSATTNDSFTYTVADNEDAVSNVAIVIINTISIDIDKLLAYDGSPGDGFGGSISISGDTAVIGAYHDDDNGLNSGSAYIFVRDNNGDWNQQAKLLASDGSQSDSFGISVSISGETVIIGASLQGDDGLGPGAAYIFTRDSNENWNQQAKLVPNDFKVSGIGGSVGIGRSVSISGDTAIIGAPLSDDNGFSTGSAFIFTRDSNGDWSQQEKLLANDRSRNDNFGGSVSISGGTVIIGAHQNDDNGSLSGSAYIFVRDNNGGWNQQVKLLANDGSNGDNFGGSVSISGGTIVIVANGSGFGATYVFGHDSNGNWTQQAKLVANDGSSGDYFGSASISEDIIIIGASGNDDQGSDSGSAYVFIRDSSGNWNQQATLLANDGRESLGFGSSVSVNGKTAIIAGSESSYAVDLTKFFPTITPIADLIAPVITLNESPTINLMVGDTYFESGATAIDDIDGEISVQIIIDSSAINTAIVGTYNVTYNVSDAAGNAAEQIVRTVVVEQSIDTSCGMGLGLDGINDWVNIPDLTLAGDFTIEGWFNLASGIDYRDAIFGQEGSGPDIHFSAGRVRLYAYGIRVTAKTPLLADTWGHIAITRSGSNLTVYVNGVKDATGRWNGPLSIKAIGRGNRGFAKGMMDEIRIWELARTETEIGNSYATSVDPNAAGLMGYWRFNDADQIITDASSFANHGTLGISNATGADDPIRLDSTVPLSEDCDGIVEPPETFTAPIANNDTVGPIEAGSTISFTVTNNDTDADGDLNPESVSIVSSANDGNATVNANGSITYVNTGTTAITDTLSYTVADSEGLVSNEATVSITVTEPEPEPVAPIANNDTAGPVETGASITFSVTDNDVSNSGNLNLASIVIVSALGDGIATVNASGTITYQSTGTATTTDTLSYTIADTQGTISNVATVAITVTAAPTNNEAPVTQSDAVIVQSGEAVTIDVLANDSDADGSIDKTSLVITNEPNSGTVEINLLNGKITYTPDDFLISNDSFSYKVKDDQGAISNEANVEINNKAVYKLLASDHSEGDLFGWSVSVSGSTAVIGRRNDNSAYVFSNDGNTGWIQQAKLRAADNNSIHFGNSVSIKGDTLVIGADRDIENGTDSGSAYIFARDENGDWNQQAKILAEDGNMGGHFGSSVSIVEGTVVIGAGEDNVNGDNSGSAYIFVRDGNNAWNQQAKLVAEDGNERDHFGSSVSISENTVLVGANNADNGSGSAYTFVRDGDNIWKQQTKLVANNGGIGEHFGASVSIMEDTLVIGTPYEHLGGSAYIFVRDENDNWNQQSRIVANDGSRHDHFGTSVSISGKTIVVGASSDDTNGSTYVFARDINGEWNQQTKLAGEGSNELRFGAVASVSGGSAIIGAPVGGGSAYIFDLKESSASCRKAIDMDGINDWINIPDFRLANDFTIEGWFKLAPGIDYRDAIFGQEGSGPDIHFSAGRVRLYAYGIRVTAKTPLTADTWGHIAITRSGTDLTVYINGVKDSTGQWKGILNIKAIGRGNRGFVKGMMDEIRIWEIARTETEIGNSYDQSIDANIAGLLGYWNFNGADQTITDLSTMANHGTLGASAMEGTDDPMRLDTTIPLIESCD